MHRVRRSLGENRVFRALTHPWSRRFFRVSRTIALGGGLCGLGYATGMHDAVNDPEGTRRKLLSEVLAGQTLLLDTHADVRLVRRIGAELVHSAQNLLGEELEQAQQKSQGTAEEAEEATAIADKLRAMHREWSFVVVDSETVNAFVTDMLPGIVFVHRGLLDLMERQPEQISFVLGHELSHFLLEHGSKDRQMQVGLSMMQLALLAAVDPTGLLSFLAELGAVSSLANYGVSLPSSREHESEADALGLALVARACRDPREGIKAHEQLAKYELAAGGHPEYAGFGATHPATRGRIEALRLQLPDAMRIYNGGECHKRKRQLQAALERVCLPRLGSAHGPAAQR